MATLLDVRDLTVAFDTEDGRLTAVDGVSMRMDEGEVVGLVGESGCGKSVTALSLLRLIPCPPGRIVGGQAHFRGRELLHMAVRELRAVRGREIGMIFQEPMTALSPLRRIGEQVAEVPVLHGMAGRREAREQACQWLERVGIPDAAERMYAYPHQLSGGMRQRVMIAMAMILHPGLLIADEPTTALDVTVQAQVLDLMREMRDRSTAVLLITHDMGVISEMCTRVLVMYAGQIVEEGPVDRLVTAPAHPYAEALLRAVPSLDARLPRMHAIPGQAPSPRNFPPGCRFNTRCPYAFDRCRREAPPLYPVEGGVSRCFLRDTGS